MIERSTAKCNLCEGRGLFRGFGEAGKKSCTRCSGTGQIITSLTCLACKGEDKVPCTHCAGKGCRVCEQSGKVICTCPCHCRVCDGEGTISTSGNGWGNFSKTIRCPNSNCLYK